MTPQPAEQNDFRAYVRALWRWKWLMLAFLIVIPTISYVAEARKTKEYESSTLVRPQAVSIDLSQFGGQSLGPQNIDAVARLVKTTAVANAAAKNMKNPPPVSSSLLGSISASPDTDTGFLTLTARGSRSTARRGHRERVRPGHRGPSDRSAQRPDRHDDRPAPGPDQPPAEGRPRPRPALGAAAAPARRCAAARTRTPPSSRRRCLRVRRSTTTPGARSSWGS